MQKHPVRKFFSLLAIYAIIIFGIFVLQFRSQSIVSAVLGALHMSFVQSGQPDNPQAILLQNKFTASFNGINFSTSDENSVKLHQNPNDLGKNITLISWEQTSPLSAKLIFQNKDADSGSSESQIPIAISVIQSEESNEQSLILQASLPSGYYAVSIPYKTSGTHSVTEQSRERLLIGNKNTFYEFFAPSINTDRIFLLVTKTG